MREPLSVLVESEVTSTGKETESFAAASTLE
jgi:hypothetical protein